MARAPKATPELPVERYIDTSELAAVLGCDRETVRRLRRSGRIVAALQLGRSYRYDLDAVLAALSVGPHPRRAPAPSPNFAALEE